MSELPTPTIEDLKELQRQCNLGRTHLVWVGPVGFVIAHTDHERESGVDLEDCDLHQHLLHLDEAPCDPGYYVVSDEFEFTPLGA